MEDFQMYSKIQQKKRQGFSRDAVARQLELNWRTVDHYWDMTVEDYEVQRARQYTSGLDSRKDIILQWLKEHEDVSAAQVQDWLIEHYREHYKERTVRDFVAKLVNGNVKYRVFGSTSTKNSAIKVQSFRQ